MASTRFRPYDIVATSPDAGVIEAIPDTVSLDALKKVGSVVVLAGVALGGSGGDGGRGMHCSTINEVVEVYQGGGVAPGGVYSHHAWGGLLMVML